MANPFNKIRSFFRRVFPGRRKMPVAPRLAPVGHQGIAAGRLPSLQGEQDAQKVDKEIEARKAELEKLKMNQAPQANINALAAKIDQLEKRAFKLRNPQEFKKHGGVEKWRTLGSDVVEAFIYEQEPLFVHSSNVGMVQFFEPDNKLLVEFLGGGTYIYSNISVQEAIQFAQAQSKGGWIWDNLRIRGSKKGHKKPFFKIR